MLHMKDLINLSEEKRADLKEKLNNFLIDFTYEAFRPIKLLINSESFHNVLELIKKYKEYIKDYEWAKNGEILEKFYDVMGDHYEEIFPRMVTLSDSYFEEKDYIQAQKQIKECRAILKEFKQTRTHLVGNLLKYEMICEERLIMTQIFDLLSQAENSTLDPKISDILFRISELENSIPIQFKDKKRLNVVHTKITALREKMLFAK
ncbi:hypothetical protein LCGC14_0866950 [marine sediment metagenome]|uniref:Uncharacterized protein n=1 Tax=marine sediment metagenome TaxID=412755 RepID=A0A0F9P5P7_9ZZZZ